MRGESSVLTQRVRLAKNISASSQRVSSRSTIQTMTLLSAYILTHFDTLASVKRHVSKVEISGQKPLGLRLPTVCCSTCHARSDRWLTNVRKVSQPRSGNQTLGFPEQERKRFFRVGGGKEKFKLQFVHNYYHNGL